MTLESILLLLVGLLAGAIAVFFVLNHKIQGKVEEIRTLTSEVAAKSTENTLLGTKINEERERHENELTDERQRMDDFLQQHIEAWEKDKNEIVSRYEKEREELKSQHQQEKADEKERYETRLREQITLMEERMTNATQQLLDKRSEELDRSNSKQMDTILTPLKETMEQMRNAINDTNIKNAESSSKLEEQIRLLMENTRNIGEEANKLSKALHSQTKVQGNFGEMVLTELLQRFGFREGVEYDVQQTVRDSSGNAVINDDTHGRMITDAVIHFPDDKDVIIDSKVSLTAFTDYVNADSDEEKERCLKEHLKSVRNQVGILAKKNYSGYGSDEKQTLDFMIMFVPIESALSLALANDPTLWRDAFDKKVFISGEQNLFAVLKLVQMAWTQKRQDENLKQVFKLAETFIDRMGDFTERFDSIGKELKSAQKAFDNAKNKLVDGQQSLIKPAQEMVKIGAKTSAKHPLPQSNSDSDTLSLE